MKASSLMQIKEEDKHQESLKSNTTPKFWN